jgi:hypothetical protein
LFHQHHHYHRHHHGHLQQHHQSRPTKVIAPGRDKPPPLPPDVDLGHEGDEAVHADRVQDEAVLLGLHDEGGCRNQLGGDTLAGLWEQIIFSHILLLSKVAVNLVSDVLTISSNY